MKKMLCGVLFSGFTVTAWAADAPATAPVVANYADIALASYEDSLHTATQLQKAVETLLGSPSEKSLQEARRAWLAARVPYMQTEAYRFGNPLVDEWEGKVNAWPLDEGLIDYVDASYGTESDANAFYALNIIANPQVQIGGQAIDASRIDKNLLAETLHELGGNEANVATGYHAIEFLLWGQDLNGTGPGAGNRPHTDFDVSRCTGGNCDRRAQYLRASTDLLIENLQEMVDNWKADGAARKHLEQQAGNQALGIMLTGLGSLSYGELAGERMKLGLMLNDPEEEHDCFSDNTHNSHYYDQIGMRNVYLGRYERVDGKVVQGASLSDLVKAADPALDTEMRNKLDATVQAMQALRDRAQNGEAYDQMIASGNADGNAVVQAAIDALIDQTRSIERVVAALKVGDVSIEGSDSLDKPEAVFQ